MILRKVLYIGSLQNWIFPYGIDITTATLNKQCSDQCKEPFTQDGKIKCESFSR